MVRVLRFLLFFICLLAGLNPVGIVAQPAYTLETVPDPKAGGTGYVSDPGDIISAADETQLNSLISQLEDSSTAQIAVVVLPSIGQENPKDFATRLFERWGIGQAGKDNGLLVLTVMDQRRTEFETGYGLEGVLPDAVCYRIGMQELVPYFQRGEFGPGLIAAVSRFKQVLENPEALEEIRTEPLGRAPENGWWYILMGYLGLNLLAHLLLLGWVWRTLVGKDELYDKYMGLRKAYTLGWFIFFPIPYMLLYFFLRNKLRQLREQTRFSKINGKPMRKLSELEEDEYLDKGQLTEEEIGSVDYDVWITDNADDMLILRYAKRFSKYRPCPKCGYRAYYHAHTSTIKQATYSSAGKSEVLYLCKNCNYKNQTYIVIPRKTHSSSGSSGGSSRSSGSSSWGGGRSGGGGSGVSW